MTNDEEIRAVAGDIDSWPSAPWLYARNVTAQGESERILIHSLGVHWVQSLASHGGAVALDSNARDMTRIRIPSRMKVLRRFPRQSTEKWNREIIGGPHLSCMRHASRRPFKRIRSK